MHGFIARYLIACLLHQADVVFAVDDRGRVETNSPAKRGPLALRRRDESPRPPCSLIALTNANSGPHGY